MKRAFSFHEPRSADILVRGFTGLSSPVFPILPATRPLTLATGKSPEPADRNVRATLRFMVTRRDFKTVAALHEPVVEQRVSPVRLCPPGSWR